MRQRNESSGLARLLAPRSLAILGASGTSGSFGQRLHDGVLAGEYQGRVELVNPKYEAIAGVPCYPDLASIPGHPIDLVAVALPERLIESGIRDAAAAGAGGVVVFARCYEPPHEARPGLAKRLGELADANSLLLAGPNCMGFTNARLGLTVCGNPPTLNPGIGSVALVSHSGSSWAALLGNSRGIPFRYSVSAGAEAQLDVSEYLHFFLDDPEIRVILCILETVRKPDALVDALTRAKDANVQVVALHLGRTETGSRLTEAHSGGIAGNADALRAVMQRAGALLVYELDALMDHAELFAAYERTVISGVGIVTDSGGERQHIVDLAEDLGVSIAVLNERTRTSLETILDPGMSTENPVDAFGDGAYVVPACIGALNEDPAVGSVLLATDLVRGQRAYLENTVETLRRARQEFSKPLAVMANLHSGLDRSTARQIRRLGIPVLEGTRTALEAVRNLSTAPCESGIPSPVNEKALATLHRRLSAGAALQGAESLEMLRALDIPTAPFAAASDEKTVKQTADTLGYPLVLKIDNPSIKHKSDVGGVATDLMDRDSVLAAYRRMKPRLGDDVILQRQLPSGFEMMLAMWMDAQFGSMCLVGAGGIAVEVLKDAIVFKPPISATQALELLSQLKAYPLITGYRGYSATKLDPLAETISRFSAISARLPHTTDAMEINPLILHGGGHAAVDVLILTSHTSGLSR